MQNDTRRSLIGALGSKSQDDSLVLYIPEDSLATKVGVPSTNTRRTSIGKADKLPDISAGSAGTKEGFDRFASIRRSRRYKRGPDVSLNTSGKDTSAPSTPSPQPKFVSKVDLTSGPDSTPLKSSVFTSDNSNSTAKPSRTPLTRVRQRNDARSASLIEPHHVHLALGRNADESTSPEISNDTNTIMMTSPTTAQKVNFAVPSRETSSAFTNTKIFGVGNPENDEGFEESQSSLSETNSQTENSNVTAHKPSTNNTSRVRIGSTGSARGDNNSTLYSNTRHTSKAPNGQLSVTQSQPLRRKSRQENSDLTPSNNVVNSSNNNNNKNSSRTSLLSSRSSLTSQTTVNTVREFEPKSKTTAITSASNGWKKPFSTSNPISSSPLTPRSSMTMKNNSRNNNNNDVQNHDVKLSRTGTDNNSSKAFTPRILSFMRPTASSSAKDKIDAPKTKGVSKKNFK